MTASREAGDSYPGRCRGCRRRRSRQCSRRRCCRRGTARWRRRVRNRLRSDYKSDRDGRLSAMPWRCASVAPTLRTGAVAGRAGDRSERSGVAGALRHVGGALLRRARSSGARDAARRRRLPRQRAVRAQWAACISQAKSLACQRVCLSEGGVWCWPYWCTTSRWWRWCCTCPHRTLFRRTPAKHTCQGQ